MYPEPPERKPNVTPVARAQNPSSGRVQALYRNIEGEPLIKKIKALEIKLEELLDKPSVETDIIEIGDEDIGRKPPAPDAAPGSPKAKAEAAQIYNELLSDFIKLLKIPYGSLGYLVMSDSEQIIKLYGVDTDREFYSMIDGTKMRITSPRGRRYFNLEKMVTAGGGMRWFGEAGSVLSNPAETQANEKSSDEAVDEIITAVKKKIGGAMR